MKTVSSAVGRPMTSSADTSIKNQPLLWTEPVRGPVDELTSQTTVRTPAFQACWFG